MRLPRVRVGVEWEWDACVCWHPYGFGGSFAQEGIDLAQVRQYFGWDGVYFLRLWWLTISIEWRR